MPTKREFEVIDAIVDEVVEDQEKAQKLKRALHKADGKKDAAWARKANTAEENEDSDDLWDDVPV